MKSPITNILNQIQSKVQKFKTKETETKTEQKEKEAEISTLLRQICVASGPLLLTIGLGMTFGFSAILLPQLEKQKYSDISVDKETASWIASVTALPMAAGCILGGAFNEKLGRKTTHLITCIPSIVGWLLITFASNSEMLISGRFITGFCAGMLGPATGIYIGETSEPKYRGFLLAAISLAVSFGLFLSHILGTFLHWRTTSLITSLLPLLGALFLLFVPESPSWLAKNNKSEEAEKSFYWCRGYSSEAKNELSVMITRHTVQKEELPVTLKEKIKSLLEPEFLKPLGILSVYIVANQWAGVNAIAFYSVSIMKQTIGKDVNEYLAMLLVDVLRLVASVVACVLLRKFGRRPLAILSGVGTFTSLFLLSCFSYASKFNTELTSMSFVPLIALMVYISFISIGFVPLPWAMIGEMFPLKNRSVGSTVTSSLAFIAFFSVVKTSPEMFRTFEPAGSFLIYGLVAFLGTAFIFVCLPETKGKTLHEIEDGFKNISCFHVNKNVV